MQTAFLPRITQDAIRHNAANGLIYLNNPKVGCSTIKTSLWQAITGQTPAAQNRPLHVVDGSPFANTLTDPDAASRAFVFTFVRNPYQRLVSAYLNKVQTRQDNVWAWFAERRGLDPVAPMSFDGFVDVLAQVPPEEHDPHWRPQQLNILYPFVRPNFIGDLEGLDHDLAAILLRLFGGGPVVQGRRHGTTARQSWQGFYGDAGTLARVRAIYADDFAAFGYATALDADPGRQQASELSLHDHPGLAAVVRYQNAPPKERFAALNAVQAVDGAGALDDWILMQRLRYPRQHHTSQADLIAANGPQIAGGPVYLRRLVDKIS